MQKIAVYGSAMVKPDSDEYRAAYAVGAALANAGYAVMSGGYMGVMGGVSHGAADAGGHVIGVTTARIEAIRTGLDANGWLTEEIHHDSMRERLLHLVMHADGYVIMPGGLGTLTELALAWELLRVGDLPPRPLVVYGAYWRTVLEPLKTSPYVRDSAWESLQFVDDPQGVIDALKRDLPNIKATHEG